MYGKSNRTWMKHWDFIILDMLMLQLAYICSYILRMDMGSPYQDPVYRMMGSIIWLADISIVFFVEPYHGIRRRGGWAELLCVGKQVSGIGVLEACWLFLTQSGQYMSRLSFIWFLLLAVCFMYTERMLWKCFLCHHRRMFGDLVRVLVIVTPEEAGALTAKLRRKSYGEYEVIGIAVIGGKSDINLSVNQIPILNTAEEIPDYLRTRWIDSVFVGPEGQRFLPEGLIRRCIDMGITVHSCLEGRESFTGNQVLNRVGGYRVLTSSVRLVPERQLILKRMLDIAGGVFGILLTGGIGLFLCPAIWIASPGPVLFSQIRVGKNGKRFRIYKFRSMYPDAEARKQELASRNEMKGLMFKMTEDPRIIGSGTDGSKKGLGWFMRKYSLDEFPQFWNVLKGDMSLVGTRPPTEEEWRQYEESHRARMAVKPGLTGIWQTSGRNDIHDFEQIVEMDMQYVKSWNIGMDMRILLKTFWVVLTGDGAR